MRRGPRVLLENGSLELGNVGDYAMLLAAARRIHERWPNAEVGVITQNVDACRRLLPSCVPVPATGEGRSGYAARGLRKARALLANAARTQRGSARARGADADGAVRRAVRRADAVIASGGGYFTDAFPHTATRVDATLRCALDHGLPTFAVGQGLGPFGATPLRSDILATLSHLHLVTLRERLRGLPMLRAAGMPRERLVVTGDEAISLAVNTSSTEPGTAIGVNLRVARYSGLSEERAAAFGETLRAASRQHDARLLPIPISTHAADSDAATLATVFEGIPGFDADADCSVDLVELFARVNACRLVVTGSYHAGVFALATGASVVGIAASDYYRDKFEGLADQFGVGCAWFDAREADAPERLAAAVRSAWDRAPDERAAILDAAIAQVSAAREAFAQICDVIEGQAGR